MSECECVFVLACMCSCFVCVHVLSVYVQVCHISMLCVCEGTCAFVWSTCYVGM